MSADAIPVGPPARRMLEARVAAALELGSDLAFVHVSGLDPNGVVQRLAPLAPVTRLGAAEEFAVLLHDGVRAEDVLFALDAPGVTVAIGVAPSVEGMTTGQLLGAADRALRDSRRRVAEAAEREPAPDPARPRFAGAPLLGRVARPLR